MKQPGQIVLFRFPRTDLDAGKLRQALLLRKVPGDYEDWLVCMVSSQLHQFDSGFDELISTEDADFESSGLKVSSVIRIGRLAIVEDGILIGSIGQISSDRVDCIRRRLANWIDEGS